MTLKYSTAALALFLVSGIAYAEDSNTTTTGSTQSGTEATGTDSTQSGTTTSGTSNTGTSTSGTTITDSGSTAQTGTSTDSGTTTTDSGTTTTDSGTTTTDSGTTTGTGTTTTTTEVPKTDTDTSTSSTTSTTGDAATTTSMTPSTGTMSNAMLASQFMGQTVYSTANENVGEINDLVLNKELDTVTAIIGVGGFLGIGEKDVAIPVDQLTAAKDENNNIRLTISASKEQLEAAPAFDRTALN